MSHDYHDALPGYHPDQILIDGCRECEARAKRHDHGISTLDSVNFDRAVVRAQEWNRRGLQTISDAEVPLLTTLWSVWLQFERRGASALFDAAVSS